ncbi:hypothetical protein Y032_0030g2178 [Ancylostoma ceylanicum]|uniref:SCP domain-containing protein n=1 Tax=Ancylostoma ceylanicum TaxID=53326 RepID=A0A016UQE6_9BILA|nr:hypothetical protein Y032_0030g2178 [Ancylostoma ceylanicum]
MRCVHLLILAVLPLMLYAAPPKEEDYRGRLRPADCVKPKKFPMDSLDAFVIELNRRRRLMADGWQQNGPRGNVYLPKGENLMEMEWSCGLEEKAIAALNTSECNTSCPAKRPNAPNGTTGFFDCQNVSSGYDPMGGSWLRGIYSTSIKTKPGAPVMASMCEDGNRDYCNLVRYNVHRIGCAETQSVEKKCVFCLTDKPPLQDGDTVYNVGGGSCPKGKCHKPTHGCDPETGLCFEPLPVTTPKPLICYIFGCFPVEEFLNRNDFALPWWRPWNT